jgi:putative methyltransferase (TIGR04325 family)
MVFNYSLQKRGQITILDIGGGAGDNYFALRRNITNKSLSWQIVDSKNLWDRFYDTDYLEFGQDHLKYVTKFEKSDLVLVIGTLHYLLDEKLTAFRAILDESRPETIIISRTPFSDQEANSIMEQRAITFDAFNQESEDFVPLNLRNLEGLLEEFQKFGYQLIHRSQKFPYQLNTRDGQVSAFYQDLYLTRSGY